MMLFAEITQYVAFGAALCVLIWMILRRSQSKFSRTRLDGEHLVRTPRPERKSQIGLVDAPADVVRWEVAMYESARDMKAELDSKMVALQTLTRLAQAEADRLEAAIKRAQQLGIGAPRDLLARIEDPSPDDSIDKTSLALPPQLRQQIYSLADQGRSASDIAESLGAPLGEVELALSLRTTRT